MPEPRLTNDTIKECVYDVICGSAEEIAQRLREMEQRACDAGMVGNTGCFLIEEVPYSSSLLIYSFVRRMTEKEKAAKRREREKARKEKELVRKQEYDQYLKLKEKFELNKKEVS